MAERRWTGVREGMEGGRWEAKWDILSAYETRSMVSVIVEIK